MKPTTPPNPALAAAEEIAAYFHVPAHAPKVKDFAAIISRHFSAMPEQEGVQLPKEATREVKEVAERIAVALKGKYAIGKFLNCRSDQWISAEQSELVPLIELEIAPLSTAWQKEREEMQAKLDKVARCVEITEKWDESRSDKEVELAASFSEAMAYTMLDEAEAKIRELENWKRQAMQVMGELDSQKIATMLARGYDAESGIYTF